MSLISNAKRDLYRLRTEYEVGTFMAILANRGFHALFFYRIANSLNRRRIPFLPLLLTRIVQIMYSIDIDYKAQIEGGIVILHGVGIVIGQGAIIKPNCTIYHGVTLGRKKQGAKIPPGDGYPIIHENCLLGAGAKLIGPVEIGCNCIIGPNCVIMNSLEPYTVVKIDHSVNTNKFSAI
jgi:serine O-acetyltransferase